MNRRSFFGAMVGGALAACGVKTVKPVRDVVIPVAISGFECPRYITITAMPFKYRVGMKLRAVTPKELAKTTVSRSWRVA